MKLIQEETRIQQINALPNISFVRWDGEYKNSKSKAVCRCAVDGFEWAASVGSLVNGRYGCPHCAKRRRWTAEERIEQINGRPNIQFVRWEGEYRDNESKAICRCAVDGFEWAAAVAHLVRGTGCPQCSLRAVSRKLRRPVDERVAQINEIPNISFIRWEGVYRNSRSKAVYRCAIDGYEWKASVGAFINNGRGCPRCAGSRRRTAEERIEQINALPNISFVRWHDDYTDLNSKAICRCAIDGVEWATRVDRLLNAGTGCPQCAPYGYRPGKPGTLYILRSECGTMVKIGISNKYKKRLAGLRRRTPFDWNCIELLHSDDGSLIAEWEKELHSFTEQAQFSEPFDGYTEWRKWDDRLPMWLKRYRARLERYNKAP